MESSPKRPRVSVELDPELHRSLREAAANRNLSVREYVVQAIEQRLQRDSEGGDRSLALDLKADPVLAELWDNPRDAAYDRL